MMQRSGVWNANEVRWSLVFWASTYIFFMKVSSKQMCTAKGNSLWNLTSNSPVMSGLCWQHTLIEQFWPFVGPVLLEIFDPRGSHIVSRVALLFLVEDRALLSQSRTESPKDRAVDELRCHCSSNRDDAVTKLDLAPSMLAPSPASVIVTSPICETVTSIPFTCCCTFEKYNWPLTDTVVVITTVSPLIGLSVLCPGSLNK